MNPDDNYEQQNDFAEVPTGIKTTNDYASRTGPSQNPVEDPYDPATTDTDQQLARDEEEAIDEGNVLKDCTRGATKQKGTYAEPVMRRAFLVLMMEHRLLINLILSLEGCKRRSTHDLDGFYYTIAL